MDVFKKQFWISAGIIILTIILGTVAVYFLIGDVATRSAQVLSYRSAIAMQSANLGNAAQLKKDAVQAAKYKAAMDQLLPGQDSLISFPQMIDTLARSYSLNDQVTFTGSAVAATAAAPGSISFSLEVDGSNDNCIAFLKNLESKAGVLVKISGFEIAGSDTQSRLTMQGLVFFQ